MGDAGAQGLLFARFTWEGPGVAGALVRSPWGGRGGAWLLVRLVCAGRIKLLGYEKLLQPQSHAYFAGGGGDRIWQKPTRLFFGSQRSRVLSGLPRPTAGFGKL